MIEPTSKEFTERVIEINRVMRAVKGGKRLRFRALVIIGNRQGRGGWGLGKASDVSQSIRKALNQAQTNLRSVYLTESGTIPYPVEGKFKKARVLLKPALRGTGVIAGGAIRTVLELLGLKNIVSKALGSGSKLNNALATFQALAGVVDPQELLLRRGREIQRFDQSGPKRRLIAVRPGRTSPPSPGLRAASGPPSSKLRPAGKKIKKKQDATS